jgi:membrane fusion protein (multidrug efflux system)
MSSEPQKRPLFREEALRARAPGVAEGEILQLSPIWAEWCYRVLVVIVLAAMFYVTLGELSVYATGPAVVWRGGRTALTAANAGVVRAVEVRVGQSVGAGAVLLRLNDAEPRAELERVEREFELQLVRMLRDPMDDAARSALTTLRAQRELAAARLEEFVIRAPRAGAVVDLRVREGQRIAAGDPLLSLAGTDDTCSIVALLPGHAAPQLQAGTPLRLEITGYPYAYQDLEIESIGSQVLGPAEARRYLGPGMADALTIEGPVVLVHARPPSSTFVSQGFEFAFVDGMVGRVDARLDSESILFTILPGLTALRGRKHQGAR